MFFILGSRNREIEISSGFFICPACGQLRRYKRKRLARYFTLWFVPLFPVETLGEFVQCQTCQHSYPAEALQRAARLVTETDLENAVKAELERGLPFHRLQRRLADDGLDREEAAQMIHRLTGGEQRTCPQCQFSYLISIRYCTNCGHDLLATAQPPEPKRLN